MNEKVENEMPYSQTGSMPSYDSPKPICFNCKSSVWVISVGRDDCWDWNCLNCVVVFGNKLAKIRGEG